MNNPALIDKEFELSPQSRGIPLVFLSGIAFFVFLALGYYVHPFYYLVPAIILISLLFVNKNSTLCLYVLSFGYSLPLMTITAEVRLDDLFFVVIISIWLMSKALNPSKKSTKPFLAKALIAWVAVNALSIVANILHYDNRQIIYSGYYLFRMIEYILIYFIFVDMINTYKLKITLIRLIWFTTLFVCLYGLYQYHFTGVSRVTSTLSENHAHIGSFLVFTFFVLVGYASYTRNSAEKLWLVLSLPLIVYVLFLSASRAAIVALFCGILVYFIFKRNFTNKIIAIGIIFLIIFVGFDFLISIQDFQLGTAQFENLEQDISLFGRFYIWIETVNMILENPIVLITGIGLGAFQYVMNPITPFFDGVSGGHNNYLHVLTETGIAGFMLFVYILMSFLKVSLQRARNTASRKGFIYYGYFCGTAALTVTAFTQETFSVQIALHNILGYFFLVTALVFSEPEIKDDYTEDYIK